MNRKSKPVSKTVALWTREHYTAAALKTKFRPGDRVRVLRDAKDYESGWGNSWVDQMDDAVGKTLTVSSADIGNGVALEDGHLDYEYPFFVLRLVRKAPKIKLGAGK